MFEIRKNSSTNRDTMSYFSSCNLETAIVDSSLKLDLNQSDYPIIVFLLLLST